MRQVLALVVLFLTLSSFLAAVQGDTPCAPCQRNALGDNPQSQQDNKPSGLAQPSCGGCGATAVVSFARLAGKQVESGTADRLSKKYPQTMSFAEMQEELERLGLQNIAGYRASFEELVELNKPAIAHVNVSGIQHFVVVEKATAQEVKVLDGDNAQTLPAAEFKKAYSGVILCVAPEEENTPGGLREGRLQPHSDSLAWVGLREAFGGPGARIYWTPKTGAATMINGTLRIRLWVGRDTAYVNGKSVRLAAAPRLMNGRVEVPRSSIPKVTTDPASPE